MGHGGSSLKPVKAIGTAPSAWVASALAGGNLDCPPASVLCPNGLKRGKEMAEVENQGFKVLRVIVGGD